MTTGDKKNYNGTLERISKIAAQRFGAKNGFCVHRSTFLFTTAGTMLFADLPSDVCSKILSFCGCGELLTLRRTSRSVFPDALSREFRLRVPSEVLEITDRLKDVRVYVTLLHHASNTNRSLICKTAGSKLFRLRAQDLEGLSRTFKRNCHYSNAAPMELFSRVDLFVAALKRHGSVAKLRAYDATLRQRASTQATKKRAKEEQTRTAQNAQREQMLVRGHLFLTRIDEAYQRYLGLDTHGAYDEYTTFRDENIEEYRAAFCADDRGAYECYAHEVNERNGRALRAWYRRSRAREDESHATRHAKKRKAPDGDLGESPRGKDVVCTTCLDRFAARKCTNQCCGVCCGVGVGAARRCARHARGVPPPVTL